MPFAGYVSETAQPVAVEALNPTTGAFVGIGSATSGGSPISVLGTDWYGWATAAQIPTAYWVAGQTGATAIIRGRTTAPGGITLYGLEENWASYSGTSLAEFRDYYTTGNSVRVCTSDYAPFGSRRGPCPPRQLVLGGVADTTRQLPDTTSTLQFSTAPTSLAYRGDANSFIDVFDALPTSTGFNGANVARRPYNRANSSTETVSVTLPALGAPLSSGLSWRGTRTVRQYDRGQCSTVLLWRDVLDSLIPVLFNAVQSIVLPGAGTISLTPLSRTVLTPMIRLGAGDALRFTQSFWIDSGSSGRITFSAIIRLGISAGNRLTAVVEDGSTVDFQPSALSWLLETFGALSEAEIEASALAQVRTRVPAAIQLAIPASVRFLPIMQRVYVRPDALEIVLAEDTRDPNYPTILAAPGGLCTRPNPTTAVPQSGAMSSLFDPPLAGDPRVLGDTRRP